MIDFEKYGKEKSTTTSGTVVDWNNYGTPLTSNFTEEANKPFKYDVPETQKGKISRYQQEAQVAEDESKKANSFTEKYLKPVAGAILPGVPELGETLGGIKNTKDLTKTYEDAVHNASTVQFNLIRKINENKKLGKDTKNLEQLYNEGVDQLLNLDREYSTTTKGGQKSTKQVAGELGMTALNALLFGTYGEATAGMQGGKLAVEGGLSGLLAKTGIPSNIVKQTALPSAISKTTGLLTKPSSLFTREGLKNVALGTGIGEAFDITQNLQEDKSGTDILTGGYAKYIGGGIPLLTEGSKSIANKFSKDIARDELGTAYRDTIAKYTRPQTILDNAERINKTDPVSVLQMYGKETVPTMTENGRVNPQEQIDFLKSKIKELSEVKNEAVFLNDNTVTAPEYRKYIDGIVDAQKNWTDGKKLAEKKAIDKIFQEIEDAQGEKPFEMNQIDKIKTEQTGLSKSYNNPQAAFSYDAHGAIGKASRDLVEMFSDDTAVRDLNKLIQGHYDAIDILNSLKGKTPKGGMMSKHFSRVSGQILGYGAGSAVGHPFAGAAVGQIVSNEVQSIIQSNFITNPLKRLLINNLKEQAPKEVTTILKSMEAKYGDIFDELGLSRQPQSKPAGTQKLPPEESGTVPPESYIKQGLREGKELGQVLLNYAKEIKNNAGLSIKDVSKEIMAKSSYKEAGNLTTKILRDLEGKTTVSKQYILDATNRGELKQVERDLIREVLETFKGEKIDVAEFAEKVKEELLPLKVVDEGEIFGNAKYESTTLPKELRGDIKDYKEKVYESPIKTSAGGIHFPGKTPNYFGHTRIEDMADDATRRVIEVQSDLYQKGRLENEFTNSVTGEKMDSAIAKEFYPQTTKDFNKLAKYNDPTAHFRMIREEIKKAAQDGKTKLQFPTGDTAMKVEGLGDAESFMLTGQSSRPGRTNFLKPEDLEVGQNIISGEVHGDNNEWVITEVLGDGKFKAIPKDHINGMEEELAPLGYTSPDDINFSDKKVQEALSHQMGLEQFDISGKVDKENPIYKFYEKDVQHYLKKFGGKKVIDDKGVEWIEVPIKKEWAKEPVDAFGHIMLTPLFLGAGLSAAVALATTGNKETYKASEVESKSKPTLEESVNPELDQFGISRETLSKIEKETKVPSKILSALLSLESSDGYNKASADEGEYKWLTGLTDGAIKDLKRDVDVSNPEDVLKATAEYWNLLHQRNPKLSPEKLYSHKYWTLGTKAQKLEKEKQFLHLIK